MGDGWALAAAKNPAGRQACLERAGYWCGRAWTDSDAASKTEIRKRLRKLLQGPGQAPKSATAPAGWRCIYPTAKVGPSTVAARSGKLSMQVVCGKTDPKIVWAFSSEAIPAKPGSACVFSAWVLTDETESEEDSIIIPVFDKARKLLDQPRMLLLTDRPWWRKLEATFTVPEAAGSMEVHLMVASSKGTIFTDDLSLKIDGKEVLKNTGFEEK